MTLIWIGLLIIGVVIVLSFVWSGPRSPVPSPGPGEGTPPDPDDADLPLDTDLEPDQQYGHQPLDAVGAGGSGATYPREVSLTAILSLGMVIVMVVGEIVLDFGFLLLMISAISAVVFGHLGIRDTARGDKTGSWMAVIGLIMGYFGTLIGVSFMVMLGPFVLAFL